jgi:hypothetical protein
MNSALDPATLATLGGIIAAFGAAMLFFRIQRELTMGDGGEIVWLPWADWLLVAATMISLLLVILPITIFAELKLATVASGAAAIMVAGYVLAILAHYRIIFGRRFLVFGGLRTGPRTNPEPSELILVLATLGVAAWIFARGLAHFSN